MQLVAELADRRLEDRLLFDGTVVPASRPKPIVDRRFEIEFLDAGVKTFTFG